MANFWPTNDENTLYLPCHFEKSIRKIIYYASEHFKVDPEKIMDFDIEIEYIHCYAIGYDLYDPADYVKFYRITRPKN